MQNFGVLTSGRNPAPDRSTPSRSADAPAPSSADWNAQTTFEDDQESEPRAAMSFPMIAASILIFVHLGRPFDRYLTGLHIPLVLCSIGIVVMLFTKWLPVLRSRIGICLVLFLGSLCLASLFSFWRGGSAAYVQQYIQFHLVIFCLVAAAPKSVANVRWLVFVMLFSCAFDLAIGYAFDSEGRMIIKDSSLGNSGDVALLGGASIPLILLFAQRLSKPLGILLGVVGVLGGLIVCELSGTRSALLALTATGIVYFLRGTMARRMGLIFSIVALAVGSVLFLPKANLERLSTITATLDPDAAAERAANSSEAIASLQERRQLSLDAIQAFLTHPVWGVGPDSFSMWRFELLGRGGHAMAAHDTYLQVAAEEGLLGIVTYIAFVLAVIFTLHKCSKPMNGWKDGRQVANAIEPSYIYFIVTAFSLTCVDHTQQFVLAGMAVALERLRREKVAAAEQTQLTPALAAAASASAGSFPNVPPKTLPRPKQSPAATVDPKPRQTRYRFNRPVSTSSQRD